MAKGYLHAQVMSLTERALAVPGLLTGVERAKTLLRLAAALDPMGRRARQEECIREAELLAQQEGDDRLRASAVNVLGVVFLYTSRYDESEAAFRRALELAIAVGDRVREANPSRDVENGVRLRFRAQRRNGA